MICGDLSAGTDQIGLFDGFGGKVQNVPPCRWVLTVDGLVGLDGIEIGNCDVRDTRSRLLLEDTIFI